MDASGGGEGSRRFAPFVCTGASFSSTNGGFFSDATVAVAATASFNSCDIASVATAAPFGGADEFGATVFACVPPDIGSINWID